MNKEAKRMPKVTFEIPIDIKDIVQKHTEIDWDKIVANTLWNYAKKIKLLDSIACKSTLSEKDIEMLDHEIKFDLIKKYQKV